MAISLPENCSAALGRHLRPELFKALCDPNRLALIAHLAVTPEPLSVSEASGCCGVHLSGTSRHLSMLRDAGVVVAERAGREVRYRLDVSSLVATLRGLADAIEDCCGTHGCCAASTGGSEDE